MNIREDQLLIDSLFYRWIESYNMQIQDDSALKNYALFSCKVFSCLSCDKLKINLKQMRLGVFNCE